MSQTAQALEGSPAELALPRSPLRELLGLALPTVLQMASYNVMQFIDTWMLSKAVGPAAPAAASQAGGLAFAFLSFGMGVILVVNTLVSQNYGQRSYAHCGRYLWQGVWVAVAYSALMLPLMFLMPSWFKWFGHSARMVEMEAVFVRIMIATAVFKLVQTAFSQFMLATDRPNLVLLSSVIGVSVNAIAAYLMLFGVWGVPRLGILGAAWGQAIGCMVELVTLVVFALFNPQKRALYRALDWMPRFAELKTLVRVGAGSGLQFMAEVLAWSLFGNWVFGRLGETAMEANAFMLRYLLVTFLPAYGVSAAVTALVGRYIGMKRPDLAMQRAHLGFKVTLLYLLVCGTVYVWYRRELVEVFTTDAEVLRLGAILMVFAAFYAIFDGMYIVYYGALRGAGDTFVPAVATAGFCWTIMLFGGYSMAHWYPEYSVAGPWSIASVYGVILGIFMLIRFQRGKWRAIHLEPDSNDVADSARLSQPSLT